MLLLAISKLARRLAAGYNLNLTNDFIYFQRSKLFQKWRDDNGKRGKNLYGKICGN